MNRPEEAVTVFAHGWLHTGDLAMRSPDGFYSIVDRKMDTVIGAPDPV